MFGDHDLQRVAAVDLRVADSLPIEQLFSGEENTQAPRVDVGRGLNLSLY